MVRVRRGNRPQPENGWDFIEGPKRLTLLIWCALPGCEQSSPIAMRDHQDAPCVLSCPEARRFVLGEATPTRIVSLPMLLFSQRMRRQLRAIRLARDYHSEGSPMRREGFAALRSGS
jgi:hypothetical protein